MNAKDRTATFSVYPFLKWAGGKRWLVQCYPELFAVRYRRYVEPFVGSGAVFYYLQPSGAILGDINRELIETYQALRDDWKGVYGFLKEHQKSHSKEYYYRVRRKQLSDRVARAARLIYLNRTCWNGLYRVNREGRFNVPLGTKTDIFLPTDDFENASHLLERVQLVCSDFEPVIEKTHQGDLVFVDPPYTVCHGNNGFIKYNENLFSWSDQIRLAQATSRAVLRGVMVLVTNAFHSTVMDLYRDLFVFRKLKRFSLMAASPGARKPCFELVAISRNMEEELNNAKLLS